MNGDRTGRGDVRHNHFTRDIKPLGKCPACDRTHAAAAVARPAEEDDPRCPATITAPGWGTGRCAKPAGHGGLHDGVRWWEIASMTSNWVVDPGGASDR